MKKRKILFATLITTIVVVGGIFAGYPIAFMVAETPEFSIPVHNIEDVTGVQVFHDNMSTQLHIGFDFKLDVDSEIFAPVSGKITNVKKHQMTNGYWLVDVFIKINVKWTMFIAFEPWTTEEAVIDDQLSEITVNIGDRVEVNQSLGFLTPVPGSEFPHIHWTISYYKFLGAREHVSPYDYLNPEAQSLLWDLCQSFGKLPEDPL